MPSLIDTVISSIPSDALSRVASLTGATPAAASSALGAATPALLAGALHQSSTPGGAANLLSLVNQATAGGNPLDRVGSILSADDTSRGAYMSQGHTLAEGLLGGRTQGVVSALSRTSNMGAGAISTLLSMLAPLVLGAIARGVGPSPTVSGLQSLLGRERASILDSLPHGLGALFGLGPPASAPMAAAVAAPAAPGVGRFLPWILAAVAAVILILALRAFMTKRPVEVAPTQQAQAPAITAPTLPAIPKINLRLPGGASIDVPPGSIGFNLARFLESNERAPKTFVFDNLNYDTASNALTPESQPTVAALAAILKAYPNVRGRVVGYTDNQGDPAANKTLSDGRANTVKSELVGLGIAADRIETAGMGEADPVADNATEDGRAKNRRTELTVVKK